MQMETPVYLMKTPLKLHNMAMHFFSYYYSVITQLLLSFSVGVGVLIDKTSLFEESKVRSFKWQIFLLNHRSTRTEKRL